jgi:hypothetical protein
MQWCEPRHNRVVGLHRRPGGGERLRFARLIYVVAAGVALTGCATTRYSTIYCLSHDQQLPAEPPKVRGQLTGNADKDLTIVAGSAIRLRAWGEGLQTILEGCREK